jgi:integrase/recombinase XerD
MFLAREYRNNQPNSLNDKINKIRSFFGWLQDEGYIIMNPSKNLKPTKEPYRRRGHIEQIDIERIRNACSTTREKSIVNFLFATGCRVSELSNSKVDKINWQENSIVIIGKGDKERKVYFDAKTRLCLLGYIDEREHNGVYSNDLFIASKHPYAKLGARSIERDFGDIVKRAGITVNYSCHHCRHSFATVAVNKSVPINVLAQILGHGQISTTQLYYDNDEINVQQEYRKIAL